MIEVDKERCTGCATCLPYCPEGALDCLGVARVDDRCTECLDCLESCPVDALRKGGEKGKTEGKRMPGLDVDVLIIGSGMGGMCSGALLSHAGYRVLVVEKLPRIGGRCSTIEYKGVKCTTGVIAPELGGAVEEVFHKVGANYDVRPGGPPYYLIRGKTMEIPRKGGLRFLLTAATDDVDEVNKMMAAFSRAMGWMEPSKTISLRDWILQYTQDEGILRIFETMVTALLLVNTEELPAQEYFRFLKKLGGFGRFGFCPQGSIALPNSLLEVIQQRSGQLWTHSPVKRILSEGGVVRGAVVEKEEKEIEVRARAVISNTGPKKTVELAGRENFDKGYLKELTENVKPAMIVAIQMMTDKPLLEQSCLMVTNAQRVNALFQPTIVCPELAPAGRHILYAGAAPPSSNPPMNAEKEIALCFQDLRDLLPGFDKHAEVLLIGTFHGDWPGFYSWPGYAMDPKTSIVNLYNVGDGVGPPGTSALPATVLSAQQVVDDIKTHLQPAP